MTPVDALFDEFVTRWTREEPIDVAGLLERAGPDTDELARLIDAFLDRAPRREPSDESRAAVKALAVRLGAEPPLLSARLAARRRVGEVTAAIVAACALPAEAEALVRSYYQRLEGGLLDPRGVSDRVWTVLELLLGSSVRAVASEGFSVRYEGSAHGLAFRRLASAELQATEAHAPSPAARDQPADDVRRQVDELFTARAAGH
jgi:hypothetical protein